MNCKVAEAMDFDFSLPLYSFLSSSLNYEYIILSKIDLIKSSEADKTPMIREYKFSDTPNTFIIANTALAILIANVNQLRI
jgi:hypothetical protein